MTRRIERDVALLPERGSTGEPGKTSPRVGRDGAISSSVRLRRNGAAVSAASERSLNFHPTLEHLPEEQTLTIEVNGRPVASLVCSPVALRELAVGWAFSHRLIDAAAGIDRISDFAGRISLMVGDASKLPSCDAMQMMATLNSETGVSSLAPLVDLDADPAERAGWRIGRERLLDVTEKLYARLHRDPMAGGNHFAVATDGAGINIAAHDLSRHNAVDKVIGWTVLHDQDRSPLMLCLTGQVDAAMIAKVWRAGFPLVASTCGPTADAVDLAEAAGVTIVGCVLQPERTVYSHGWRLPISDDEPAATETSRDD